MTIERVFVDAPNVAMSCERIDDEDCRPGLNKTISSSSSEEFPSVSTSSAKVFAAACVMLFVSRMSPFELLATENSCASCFLCVSG